MIYLISQIIFILLTQIYYNMNFITSSLFITILPWQFDINLYQHFLEQFFVAPKQMHIVEYVCKTPLKELGTLLKCREASEKFLAACNSSKNIIFPQFVFTGFWQLYFKNINFLTKTKNAYYARRWLRSKLTTVYRV